MAEETAGQTQVAAARKLRQEKQGKVVSTKGNKTIIVEVTRRVPHPLYRRSVQKRKKFYAHDETNQCQVGDVVRIVESRPLSKLKRWRLAEVTRRAKDAGLIAAAEVRTVEEIVPEPPAAPAAGEGGAPAGAPETPGAEG